MNFLGLLPGLLKYEVEVDVFDYMNKGAAQLNNADLPEGDGFESGIVLLGVLLIIIFFVLRGYSRGFVQILVTMLAIAGVFYGVSYLSPLASKYIIENTGICDSVADELTERFESINEEYDTENPNYQLTAISRYPIPASIKSYLIKNNTEEVYDQMMVSFFEEYVSKYIAGAFVKIFVYVVISVVIFFLVKVTFLSMDMIVNLPGLNTADRIFGAIFGVAEGLVVTWILMMLMIAITQGKFYEVIANNTLALAIFDLNPLYALIL